MYTPVTNRWVPWTNGTTTPPGFPEPLYEYASVGLAAATVTEAAMVRATRPWKRTFFERLIGRICENEPV